MHEWKTAQSVAGKIRQIGGAADRVTSIKVRLGSQSHIDEETLRSHLSLLTAGSNAENAEIVVAGTQPDEPGADVVLESIEVES